MSTVPRWKRHAPSHEQALRSWLVDPGSLTRRLIAHCDRFELKLLRQELAMPTIDEARALGLARTHLVMVREIQLCCDGDVVVTARSLAHPRDLHGAWRSLTGLGTRSLGEVLFRDACVKREPLEFATIDGRATRRSIFRLHGRPLLVQEAFLPRLSAKRRPR